MATRNGGAAHDAAPDREAVEALARAIIGERADDGLAMILEARRAGHSPAAIQLGLLQPAARLLGYWWEADRCSFADVTVGVGRLHVLLSAMAAMSLPASPRPAVAGRCLAAAVPGDSHIFGLALLSEMLEPDGWTVERPPALSRAGLARMVADEPFDLVCLAASTDRSLEHLPGLIHLLRRSSCHPAMRVMAGGPALLGRRDLARMLGADDGGGDGAETVRSARALFLGRPETARFLGKTRESTYGTGSVEYSVIS